MASSVVTFGVGLVTDFIYKSRPKPKWLSQHDSAAIASAGVFLHNAVFFSLAVSFAGANFNSRPAQLLQTCLGHISMTQGESVYLPLIPTRLGRRSCLDSYNDQVSNPSSDSPTSIPYLLSLSLKMRALE